MHIIYFKNESKGNSTFSNQISFWQATLETVGISTGSISTSYRSDIQEASRNENHSLQLHSWPSGGNALGEGKCFFFS